MDPRDTFAAANPVPRQHARESAAVIEDINYFADLADKGHPIPFPKLVEWLKDKHDFNIGRVRAERILRDHGRTPWWK